MSCCLWGKYQGLLYKSELKQASLEDQIAPGDQIGRPDFYILVMSKIWSPIWSPGAIWSPIRSPERLVVDLVVVDAVTFSILILLSILGVVYEKPVMAIFCNIVKIELMSVPEFD